MSYTQMLIIQKIYILDSKNFEFICVPLGPTIIQEICFVVVSRAK